MYTFVFVKFVILMKHYIRPIAYSLLCERIKSVIPEDMKHFVYVCVFHSLAQVVYRLEQRSEST